ncbi:hypothetical protein LZ198_17315 [Myxococcus sp. K15C18031901]|uniref:DoxX family protein n=1 Tax=Myxococcus dinghuensis TaxID=2906761 RepID=UPI0020A78B20|nr:DoxX family protein [Myxococcus dinghuensis]MCP3100633.1 hypothetical protein [Myxococcus dinghuensis]
MSTAAPLHVEPVPPPEPAATPAVPPEPAPWPLAARIAFRFTCVLVLLTCFPYPLDNIPGGYTVIAEVNSFWSTVVPWLVLHTTGFEVTEPPLITGSGDTQLEFVKAGFFLLLSVVATLVWSILDARRPRYPRAHHFLRVYVRYVLAGAMLGYGFVKLFPSQFPPIGEERLAQPLGEFSPMGLLWTFMGYSLGYNILTGGAEVLGGLLMFFRRTTTLGALVLVGVLTNVVALNFFYDVPVKLYSLRLLLLAVFLLAPDLRRLVDVLVLNRATRPAEIQRPFHLPRRVTWGLLAAKLVLVGHFIYGNAIQGWGSYQRFQSSGPPPALMGIYDVEGFHRGGQELDGGERWRRFSISPYGHVQIRTAGNSRTRFSLVESAENKTLTLTELWVAEPKQLTLTFEKPDPTHLVLRGDQEGAPIEVHLRKVDTSNSLLLNRGFHWVQEQPFNR